ncbi:BZ3500_MvSof-1268-A1-R1_Chr2-1g04587 [Microbotryum saponariae]|uniref:BZ3500_MvSof-1268-A1-R1_Chr2-1g04587 protein n=1 Tax=Microbotryum saponariae TaxID=289078 RepID=A0A2X0KK52_9BASI|nr:BZ3500_MvSof-1268-A1-R1_Chr2-1g04587 [Microbotryum saponariae]SCZ92098.1 BZ3501_MvSof-1269-A2-R1_Chr2-1g04243 [Microbotryum saponariae]
MASTTASLNGAGGKRVSRVLSTLEFDRLMASSSASTSSSSSSPGGGGGSGSNPSTGLTRLSATPVRHVLGRDESRLGRSSTSPSARGSSNRNMTDEDEEDDDEGWNSSNVDSSPDSARTTRSTRGANTAMGAAMQGFHRNATTASPFASSRKGQPKSRSPRLPHSDEIRPGAAAIESQPRVIPLPSPIKTLPALPPLLSSTTPDRSPLLNRDPQNLTPMNHHLRHPDAYQSKSKSNTPNPPAYGSPSISSSMTTATTSTSPTRPRSISAATSGRYIQVQNRVTSDKPAAAPVDWNQYDNHSKQRKGSIGDACSRDGAGVGVGNKGTRGVMGSSGEAKRQQSTSASSSFGNTMRKTSRFFRMVTGSSASASAAGAKNDFGTSARGMKSESSLPQAMTATTPIASTFASRGPVPAVPAVPAAYATPPKPSTLNGTSAAASATSAERQSSSIDLDIKRTPVKAKKSGMSSSASSSSRELSKYSPSAPPVSSMMSKKGSRRRSLSVGSAGATALDYLRRSGIGSPETSPKLDRTAQKSGGTGTPRSVSASVRRSEEERLVNELQQWKLNTDGVLDTKTPVLIKPSPTRTEGMSRSSSAGTPSGLVVASGLPMFATREAAFRPRIGRRQPSWNEESTHGMHRSKSSDGAEGLMITPEPTRSKSLPNPNVAAPSDGMRNAGAKVGAEAAPTIRLVSATATGHEAEGHEWRSGVTAENGQDLTWSPDGSASSPVIYTEAGHSRDLSNNTIKTPSHSLPDSPTLTVRSGNSALSFTLNAESTLSPAQAHRVESQDQLRPSNQRNRALRSSVVAYPFGAAGSSTSLLGVTSPGSKGPTSFHGSPCVAKLDTTYQTPDELFTKAQSFAQLIWNEDEAFALQPKKYAEWLGTGSPLNALTLSLYIDRFDFTNLRLDLAFRKLCGKLYLKAETQQVDRILEQFSRRYYEQHATDDLGKMFKSRDVVHAASYSLLLLNTDLHVVDTTNRMTRTQFVRNTISAIQAQVDGEGLGAKEDVFGSTVKAADEDSPGMSKSQSLNTVKSAGASSTKLGALVDEGLEPMLKEMYAAIKAQPIFQPLSSTSPPAEASRSSASLSPGTGQHLNSPYSAWAGGVARTTSRRSANSTLSSSSVAFKRQSIRGFGGFLGASTSSADVRSTSPTPSAATSMSDDRYSSSTYGFHQHHHVPTIGFANSLSHTIIREQQEDDTASDGGASVTSVTDEELALLGAPWAKEGLLWRKHYWESAGKRSKEKSWLYAFVVISAGQVKMFRFDAGGGGSMRGMGGGMGGGDWTSNAQNVGEVSLIHALCSAMPPPGYSRDRPHCFVLTLPSGGSYFFQAGTPDLVAEWVSTCNYWSARLSKEPLAGGVSNMDYGWGRVSIDTLPSSYNNTRGDTDAASIRSGRSSGGASRFSIATGGAFGRDAPPMPGTTSANDRIVVNDWTPPNQPGGASQLSEESQLEALRKYAEIVKKDLAQHNVMRGPMMRLYSPRSTNAVKSLANWERKSQYLLAEIVKYQTYIEALSAAIKMRALRRGQKEVDAMLESADDDLSMNEEGRHAEMNGGVTLDTEAENESELGHRDGGEGDDSEPTVSHSTDVFGTPEQVPLTSPTPNFASGGSRTKYRSGAPSSLSVTTNGTQEDVFFDTETRASDTI